MNNNYLTFKFVIFPNSKQKEQILLNIKGYNFIYNSFLNENEKRNLSGEKYIYPSNENNIVNSSYISLLKENNDFLSKCCSRALQGAAFDLGIDYRCCDYGRKSKLPSLKEENDLKYTICFSKSVNGANSDPVTLEWNNEKEGFIKLPKLGKIKFISEKSKKYYMLCNRDTIKTVNIDCSENLYKITINARIGKVTKK